jgi:DNA polymerase V
MVRSKTNVCVERTVAELNGAPCIALDEVPPAEKQIYCTRSFGQKATSLQPVLEGLSLYAARAAEKLHAQKHLALAVHVFIHTSPFKPNYYSASDIAQLPYPTDDTRVITSVVRRLGAKLFKTGHEYLKAGAGLIEVIDKRYYQHDLLHPGQSEQADRLMAVIDRINRREGRNTIFLAAQGVRTPWFMRQQFRSPQYTTKWSDIPVAHTDL